MEEVTNYLAAFRWVRIQLRDPAALPISVHLLALAHQFRTANESAVRELSDETLGKAWV